MCVRWWKMTVEWYGIDIHVTQVKVFWDGEKQYHTTNWPEIFETVLSVVSNLEKWRMEIRKWGENTIYFSKWCNMDAKNNGEVKWNTFSVNEVIWSKVHAVVMWFGMLESGEVKWDTILLGEVIRKMFFIVCCFIIDDEIWNLKTWIVASFPNLHFL